MDSERTLEQYFVWQVEKAGAKALKFVSPGWGGAPDRIVLIPKGKCVFAEIKAPGKKLRRLQFNRATMLISMGFDFWVIDSKDEVHKFTEMIKREIYPPPLPNGGDKTA